MSFSTTPASFAASLLLAFTIFGPASVPAAAQTVIKDCYELQSIGSLGLSGSYTITDDIDCAETAQWNSGSGFQPIGSSEEGFSGALDGGGHTVRNLFIEHADNFTGLFALINAGTVENLNIENAWVSGKTFTGVLAGRAISSTFRHISLSHSTVSGNRSSAGLIGHASGCTATQLMALDVDVQANLNCGVLFGTIDSNSIVSDALARGSATCQEASSGGIAGSALGSSILYSSSYARVEAPRFSGVIAGNMQGAGISDSFAAGIACATDTLYGLAGGAVGNLSPGTMRRVYSASSVCGVTGAAGPKIVNASRSEAAKEAGVVEKLILSSHRLF